MTPNIRKTEDVLEMSYTDQNKLLDCVFLDVSQADISRCVVCAPARSMLATSTLQLTSDNGPASLACVLQLFRSTSLPLSETCKSLHYLYPAVKPQPSPNAKTYHKNYSYFYKNEQYQNLHDLRW